MFRYLIAKFSHKDTINLYKMTQIGRKQPFCTDQIGAKATKLPILLQNLPLPSTVGAILLKENDYL
jgi:hypothetical protein